jgi:glycerophosphoryl diester phosphodiesterase
VRRPVSWQPIVIAHRGGFSRAPENTLSAFRAARAAGAGMIELDVRMSADVELVVHHDLRLGRTVRGRGRIPDLPFRELRRLDAGALFHRRRERVPLLAEVLKWLPAALYLNVEVKTGGDTGRRELCARRCCEVLRRSGKSRRVVLTSFDHLFLRRVRRCDPRLAMGVLFQRSRDARVRPSDLARRVGAKVFVCSTSQVRRRFVADARSHGLAVWCYGVNTGLDLERMRQYRIDAIITDDPALMRDLLKRGGRSR